MRFKQLEKTANSLGLKTEVVIDMIVYEHQLKKLMPRKSLKKVDFNLSLKDLKFIDKIAKKLKISRDAVVASLLLSYIEENKGAGA